MFVVIVACRALQETGVTKGEKDTGGRGGDNLILNGEIMISRDQKVKKTSERQTGKCNTVNKTKLI